ncbi:MAG TPA: AraC family transcriptional regulator [Verrucomicrobiae bacterium]
MSKRQKLLKPDFVSNQVTDAQRYFLDLNPSRTAKLVAVCGGRERCLPDYVVQREDFRFHCVEFVAEGEGMVWLDGREFELKPGTAFHYAPGIKHRITTSTAQPMLKYYVDFAGTMAKKQIELGALGQKRPVMVADVPEVLELFELLQRNGIGGRKHAHEVCAALVEALLYRLAESALPSGDADTRALNTFQKLKRHLEENFLAIRKLTEATDSVHVNEAYACRLFQRFHYCSPYQYLMRLKMNHAANQLLEGNRLVKEVAEELGFSDPYNFSRAFKTVYGLSPEKFLRQSRG